MIKFKKILTWLIYFIIVIIIIITVFFFLTKFTNYGQDITRRNEANKEINARKDNTIKLALAVTKDRKTLKKECLSKHKPFRERVWHVFGSMTRKEAENKCAQGIPYTSYGMKGDVLGSEADDARKNKGGRLMTYNELVQALGNNHEWCESGWLEDRYDGGYYILQQKEFYCNKEYKPVIPFSALTNESSINVSDHMTDIKSNLQSHAGVNKVSQKNTYNNKHGANCIVDNPDCSVFDIDELIGSNTINLVNEANILNTLS